MRASSNSPTLPSPTVKSVDEVIAFGQSSEDLKAIEGVGFSRTVTSDEQSCATKGQGCVPIRLELADQKFGDSCWRHELIVRLNVDT